MAEARKSSGKKEDGIGCFGTILRLVMILSTFAVFGLLVFGGIWAYQNKERITEYFNPPTEPLEIIDVSSSYGRMNTTWFKRHFTDIREGMAMNRVDINAVKNQLLALGQVKDATVTKVYPDKLKIEITERQPVLRVMIKSEVNVVDADGVVFKPLNYDQKGMGEINKLPELTEGNVNRVVNGNIASYRVPGMEVINQLMLIAQQDYPDLYKDWKTVNLRKFDGRDYAPYASIRLKTDYADEIIFSPRLFPEQLAKLSLILKTEEQRNVKQFEYIDLSFVPENGSAFHKPKKAAN